MSDNGQRQRKSGADIRDQLRIDAGDIDFRLKWMDFSQKHIDILKELEVLARENSVRIAKEFYDQSFKFPQFLAVADKVAKEKNLAISTLRDALESTQSSYFMDIFSGTYDANYVDKRLAVGTIHHAIGVGPKMYIGSYTFFYEGWIPVLIKKYRRKPEQLNLAIQAFNKVVSFDQAVALNAYVLGYVDEVTVQTDAVVAEATIVAESSNGVLDSMTEVTNAMQEVAKGANEQASNAQTATESMEELTGSIKTIESSANEQSAAVQQVSQQMLVLGESTKTIQESANSGVESSAEASQMSGKGAEVVGQTITGMTRINEQMDDSSKLINDLGEKSDEIGKIVGVIQSIADQTNLLALNAAIEAARAGDQGRGFAVVADEVRQLAERVATATGEISGLIDNVRDGVTESVESMEKGTAETQSGAEMAKQAGESLEEIKATVDATAEKVTSIGEDADSMLTIVGEITEGVEGIAASAEQNAAAATQMAEASGKVNNIVEMFAASAEENSAAAEEVAASVDTAKEQSEAISAASKRVDTSLEELTDGLAKLAQLT